MTDLEVLFLFDEPLSGYDQKALDAWVGGSPWGRKPGTWTTWALSYGPMPENFLGAKAVVAVGSQAARFVLQSGVTTYTSGLNPRPKVLDPKLVNRAYKVTPISGFGSFRFLLVLKSSGQIAMSAKFAEQSGFNVRPAGNRKTIEALWALYMAVHAKPVGQ